MSKNTLTKAAAGTMAAVLAIATSVAAIAQDQPSKGRIVRIGPDDQGQTAPALPAPDEGAAIVEQPAAPPYWIGLAGGPLTPELRAHVDLPDDQGLLIREIVPNSPAGKSGLKNYDILLKANDKQLHTMRDLVDLVTTVGEKEGQLSLEVLRKGHKETITVKPEARPATVAQTPGGFGQGNVFGEQGGGAMLGQIPELRRFFNDNGNGQMEFRQFGPGVIVGGNDGLANVPNGVSVSVKKEGDQPAHVTVKRGNQTWEVTAGDEESLNQLPADLRPYVERMINGGGNRFDMNMGGMPPMNMPEMGLPGNRSLQQRLDALERQLQQLMDRQQRSATKPADDTAK